MLYVYLPTTNEKGVSLDEGSIYRNTRSLEELNKRNIPYTLLNSLQELQSTHYTADDFLFSFNATLVSSVKQINDVDSVAIAQDKYLSYILINASAIPTPKTTLNPFTLNYPMVAKERKGSLGINVFLVDNEKKLLSLINQSTQSKMDFIFQECISTSRGRSIRMLMINKKFVTAQVLENTSDNAFQSNAHQGAKGIVYNPTPEEIAMCEKVAELMDLDYVGIDLLFGEGDKKIFLEANSSAQFRMLEQTTGVNVASKIVDLVLEKAGINYDSTRIN